MLGQVSGGSPTRPPAHRQRAARRASRASATEDSDGCPPSDQVMSGQVRSLTGADGALVLTDAMPFSIALAEEYISLRPIVWPLAAVSTK